MSANGDLASSRHHYSLRCLQKQPVLRPAASVMQAVMVEPRHLTLTHGLAVVIVALLAAVGPSQPRAGDLIIAAEVKNGTQFGMMLVRSSA